MLDKLLLTGILLLLLTSTATGEEKPKGREVTTTPPGKLDLTWEGPGKEPSEELLEFIANWEAPSGEWISPQEIIKMEIPENEDEAIHK